MSSLCACIPQLCWSFGLVFIVLSSYSLFNVPLDQWTYYCIIKHVVYRIWLEVSKQYRGKIRRSSTFLDVHNYRHIDDRVERGLGAKLACGAVRLSGYFPSCFSFRRHMPPTTADRRCKLPATEMMESVFLPDCHSNGLKAE